MNTDSPSPESPPDLSNLRADRRETLALVLDLTQRMRSAAEAANWDDLVALEEERRPHIPKLFDPPAAVEEAPVLYEMVRLIQIQDEAIMSCAGEGLNKFRAEVRNLESGRKALKAYANKGG